jgi:glycosyltransferase involved in cell wall biosynthesis
MTYRFLHFAPIAPSPRGNGLAMRTSMFSEALASVAPVDVVVIGQARPDKNSWKPKGITLHHVSTDRTDTRLALILQIPDLAARAAALRAYGRPVTTIGLSAPVLAEAARIRAMGSWSGILLSRAYLLPLLDVLTPATRSAPVIVDLDDDDATLCREWASRAAKENDDSKAAWLEAEADAFDSLIRASADKVCAFTSASDAVARSLASRFTPISIRTIPNGIDAARLETKTSLSHSLIFVGNLSYEPNIDGLLWFIASVLPLIRAKDRKMRLVVAGSLPTEAVRKACALPEISLHPDPTDLARLYRDAAIAVVPLRSGSGSRIKILEAAVHGLPVVATRKGAEGMRSEIKKVIFIGGEEPDAFARTCLACLGDRQAALARAAQLQRLVKVHHDRAAIVSEIATLVSGLL